MSEDVTRNIEEKYDTQPTIKTVLERLSSIEQSFNQRLNSLEQRMDERFDEVVGRLDGLEGRVNTLSLKMEILNEDVLALRADDRQRRLESFRKARDENKPSGETP